MKGFRLKTDKYDDPLAYIENAFLDTQEDGSSDPRARARSVSVAIPTIQEYINGKVLDEELDFEPEAEPDAEEGADDPAARRARFRKTVMSAPRPRRSKSQPADDVVIDPQLQGIWHALPKNVEFLCSFYDDSVTKNYYRGEFKESRQELIRRLLDPELSLEETSRLLGVCPATVRRYTNRGWLTHHRTSGGQRRFRLSDIVNFVDEHGRFPEE